LTRMRRREHAPSQLFHTAADQKVCTIDLLTQLQRLEVQTERAVICRGCACGAVGADDNDGQPFRPIRRTGPSPPPSQGQKQALIKIMGGQFEITILKTATQAPRPIRANWTECQRFHKVMIATRRRCGSWKFAISDCHRRGLIGSLRPYSLLKAMEP